MPETILASTAVGLECHVLDTGQCLAFEGLVVRGGRWRRVTCPSLVALLRHPACRRPLEAMWFPEEC